MNFNHKKRTIEVSLSHLFIFDKNERNMNVSYFLKNARKIKDGSLAT